VQISDLPPDPTKDPSWQRYRIISGGYAGWSGIGAGQSAAVFGKASGDGSSGSSFDQLLQQAAQRQPTAPDAAVFGLQSLAASGAVVQLVCEALWLAAAAGFAVKGSTVHQLMDAMRGHCRAVGLAEMQQLLAGLSKLSCAPDADSLVEVLTEVRPGFSAALCMTSIDFGDGDWDGTVLCTALTLL
jgi:hypothetical protein